MAYECLRLADDVTDCLKTELGLACSGSRDEDECLGEILEHVIGIENDLRSYLDWWNLLDQTNVRTFKRKIRMLREHIEQTIATPREDRGKPEW